MQHGTELPKRVGEVPSESGGVVRERRQRPGAVIPQLADHTARVEDADSHDSDEPDQQQQPQEHRHHGHDISARPR